MSNISNSLRQVILKRRSTKPRYFNGNKIADDVVWQMLENATWAPTHGLTQPWFFQVYTGDGLEKLANFQADLYRQITPENRFKPEKYERMKTNVLKSSHVVVICMKRQESGKIPEIEEIEAVACSVQNIMLSAAAEDIRSFWGSGGITYTQELKDFLGLSEQDRCLGYLYLGYSDRENSDSKRDAVREKVQWIDS